MADDTKKLETEILQNLLEQFPNEQVHEDALVSKVKNAIKEVRRARRYPSNYTEEQIQADLYEYFPNICNIAIFDYGKIGAEGEQMHTENGVTRMYFERNRLFAGIVPFARF